MPSTALRMTPKLATIHLATTMERRSPERERLREKIVPRDDAGRA